MDKKSIPGEKTDPKGLLSGYHITALLGNKTGKGTMSLDLGMTQTDFTVGPGLVKFSNGVELDLGLLGRLQRKRALNDCFLVDGENNLFWIYAFSDRYGVAKLYEPKMDWPPTLFINGSFMHAVSIATPLQEARVKADALGLAQGTVLDTCFGLGYTSIQLLRMGVSRVLACEIAPEVLDIAAVNPWSAEALGQPERVEIHNADVSNFIKGLEAESLGGVLHDPPNFNKFEYLYSQSFYGEVHRVLVPGGRFYHFLGMRNEQNVRLYASVTKAARAAGFSSITKTYRGITATK